jgi:hypothetical protein
VERAPRSGPDGHPADETVKLEFLEAPENRAAGMVVALNSPFPAR